MLYKYKKPPKNKPSYFPNYGSQSGHTQNQITKTCSHHYLLLRPECLASPEGLICTVITSLCLFTFSHVKTCVSLSLSPSQLQVCLGVVSSSNLLRHLETSGSLFMKSICTLNLQPLSIASGLAVMERHL